MRSKGLALAACLCLVALLAALITPTAGEPLCAILAPVAILFLAVLYRGGEGAFLRTGIMSDALLIGGGLVLRSLVEHAQQFGDLGKRFQPGRVVLVASPNDGTPLATTRRP